MSQSSTEQRKLAAIMFTDMVGYRALAQRHEALALKLLEGHRRLVRDILPKQGGREVKTTGDGFLIEFPTALAAVRCAVEPQQALHALNQAQPAERQVRLRIGVHVGDVVLREGDIHGDGMNLATRLEPLAQPGGICVSEDVVRQIRNKLPHPLASLWPTSTPVLAIARRPNRCCVTWTTEPNSAMSRLHSGCSAILDSVKRTRPGIGWRDVMRSRIGFVGFSKSGRSTIPCAPSRASRRC